MAETFELPVSLLIRGSLPEVFQAWMDPAIAEQWLCDRLEGSWAPGKSVFWHFGNARQELQILAIEPNQIIKFRWRVEGTRPETEVEIRFSVQDEFVALKLRESSWPLTNENVAFALDQACGWENLFCRLKAWTEAKVKLR